MIVKDFKNCPSFRDGAREEKCFVCDDPICPKRKRFNIEDPVNRPAHYNDGKIEVIDYIEDKKLGFCLGNAIKYISRAGKKDPDKEVEDIRKSIWYLKRYLKELGYEE